MFTKEELNRLENACQSKQKRIRARLKNLYPKYKIATEPTKSKILYRIEQKIKDFKDFKKLEEKIKEQYEKI